jgi:uncharacterized protein YjiS (DUF1127 family)
VPYGLSDAVLLDALSPRTDLTKGVSNVPHQDLAEKFGAWRRYQDAVRELSELNDRELSDIGIARDDIDAIARQHAAG